VIVKPRRNEEAQAHIGMSRHKKKNYEDGTFLPVRKEGRKAKRRKYVSE
jgi:hypothetical protein